MRSPCRCRPRARQATTRTPSPRASPVDGAYSRFLSAVATDIPCSSHRSLLLQHLAAAALDRSGAALGDDHLRAALGTDVDLADLVCHARAVLLSGTESGPAPLEKGADTFPTVSRRLQQHVQILLQPDAVPERQVKRRRDRFLGEAKRERAAGREPARRLRDRGTEPPRLHDRAHETPGG